MRRNGDLICVANVSGFSDVFTAPSIFSIIEHLCECFGAFTTYIYPNIHYFSLSAWKINPLGYCQSIKSTIPRLMWVQCESVSRRS